MLIVAACDYGLGPDDAVIREPFSYQFDASAYTGLRLVGVNGSVTVMDGDRDNSIRVTGFRAVRDCSLSEAEEWIDNLEVRMNDSAQTIVVQTVQPQHTGPCNLEVEYELIVPARFSADIANVNGEVQIRGLSGGSFVANVNGNVGFQDLTAPVGVFLTNGNITGRAVITGAAGLHMLTVNGNVELTIPTSSNAVLTATLTNGSIRVANLPLSGVVSTGTRLTGTLGTGDAEIRLQTTNGNITAAGT